MLPIHVILRLPERGLSSELDSSLSMLASLDLPLRLSLIAINSPEFDFAQIQKNFSTTFMTLDCARGLHRNWYAAANSIIGSFHPNDSELLLFLSTKVFLEKGCLNQLAKALKVLPDAAGVNPILVSTRSETERVAHLGYTVDSQFNLHSLYEGLPLADPLCEKPRKFQLAHDAVFMMRKADFLAVNGFRPETDTLAFVDLCMRLSGKGFFTTIHHARAIFNDQFDSWIKCGLWNSLLDRDKVNPELLKPDYFRFIQSDGLEYGITEWLHEGPEIDILASCEEYGKWLAWRKNPEPMSLIDWLGSLSHDYINRAVTLCRDLPSVLPKSITWYRNRAGRQQYFAEKNFLPHLLGQIAEWQKKFRSFHYRRLLPGIKALERAGIYNTSLDASPATYDAWLELSTNAKPSVKVGQSWPEIAVCMPVYEPDPGFFRQAIASIKNQTYCNWLLCIANDNPQNPATRQLADSFAKDDARIRICHRSENGHIAAATNTALELASGSDWAAFMDQDDMLEPDALARIAEVAFRNEEAAFIFTDEDHIDINNVRRTPIFKPDFDFAQNFGHLSVCRMDLAKSLGGFRKGFDGSQDFDFFLRIQERLKRNQIRHIALPLYHWRVHPSSTSGTIGSKPYVLSSTKKAWENMASRHDLKATAVMTENNNFFLLEHELPTDFSATLILLDEGREVSPRLLDKIHELAKVVKLEILWQPLRPIKQPKIIIQSGLPFTALPFLQTGWQNACTNAAQSATKKLLFFLSAHLVPAVNCKPEQMLFLGDLPNIAAVGGMLWKNGRLWHGGFYPDITGVPFPLLRGVGRQLIKSFCWGQFLLTRMAIGVSWHCMAMKKEFFCKGFNADFGELASVVYSLEQERQDNITLISPWSQWEFMNDAEEQLLGEENKNIFLERWGKMVRSHGLRNANLKAAPDLDWGLIL